MAADQTRAVAASPTRSQSDTLKTVIESRMQDIQKLATRHVTAEKLFRGFMAVSIRNPKLLECTPASVLNCILISAQLGLELNQPRGGLHPVPFFNGKTKKMEVVPIPDYRGLMELAYRSKQVLSIEARAVYENDAFSFNYGTGPSIFHKPVLEDRGALKCVYAVAHLQNEVATFGVLSLEDVNKSRDVSPAYKYAEQNRKDSPWHNDYLAMALKTAVRQLTNWLPQSRELIDLQRVVAMEEVHERGGDPIELFDNPFQSGEPEAPATPTRTEGLKKTLSQKHPAPAAPKTPSQAEQAAAESGRPFLTEQEQKDWPYAVSVFEKIAKAEPAGMVDTLWNDLNATWAKNMSPEAMQKAKALVDYILAQPQEE